MKQISQVLGSVALAAAALWAPQAQASAGAFAPVSLYTATGTQGVYIGIMDPSFSPPELATVLNQGLGNGSFTNYWVVDIIPAGNTGSTLSFLSPGLAGTIANFSVELYKDVSPVSNSGGFSNGEFTCLSANTGVGINCNRTQSGLLGLSPVATFDTGAPPNFAGLSTSSFLDAGRYVFVVSGTVTGTGSYNGSISVNNVPEPGTLALAGLALLGAAASLRKRKTAV